MSNQIILWSLFIIPWMTLFFMKKDEIRRYLPAAWLTLATMQIVLQAGVSLKL